MRRFVCAAFLAGAVFVQAETPVPATLEFVFDSAAPNGIKTAASGDASYVKTVRHTGGTIENGWWHVAAIDAFGQGSLQFELDRANLAGDLALVLHADWQKDTDVAVQLYDAQGRALALDLFGEMRRNAQSVGTDTFVIPLERYPAATSIMVRRLSGELRIASGGLFPVLSEVTSKAENEEALAARLGVILSPHHWIFSSTGKEFPATADNSLGTIHTVPSLEKSNALGAAILKQPNYPAYRPLSDGPLVPPKVSASNTTSFIVLNALRALALRAGGKIKPSMGSSAAVAERLLEEQEDIGFMSIALSSAEKEKFFRSHGHPLVELRFARDALEILVNASNPVRSITVPQLDAIYGTELRAGAPAAIEDWSQVGGSAQPIKIIGGELSWGTTRTFQQLVLKGGPFRAEMQKEDVVYSQGVESEVAKQPGAIGFATLRPRVAAVRALGLAPNSGEPAAHTTAEDIYSDRYPLQRKFFLYLAAPSFRESGAFQRELVNLLLSDVGQTLVARAGSLPLMASEVIAERSKLGLPQ